MNPNDTLYTGSGVGPSAWEDVKIYDPTYPWQQQPQYWDYPWMFGVLPGLLKPDLSAPTNVITTTGNNAYIYDFFGTSAAAPQVAGAAALLLAENPQLEPRHLAHLLESSALDLGAPGKDKLYGAGRLRAFEAVKRGRVSVKAIPNQVKLQSQVKISCHSIPGKPNYLLVAIFDFPTPVPGFATLDIAPPMDFLFYGLVANTPDFTPATLTIPFAPLLVGLTFYFQMAVDDTTGATGQWVVSPLEPMTILP